MLHSLDMPSTLTEDSTTYLTKSSATSASKRSSVEKQNRNSGDRAPSPSVRKDNAVRANGVKSNGAASGNGVPVGGGTVSNGQAVEAEAAQKENDDLADLQLANLSRPSTIIESDRSEPERRSQRYSTRDDGYFAEVAKTEERTFSTHVMLEANNGRDTPTNGDGANEETTVWSSNVYTDAERTAAGRSSESSMADGSLRTSTQAHRLSSPPPPQGSSSSTNLSTTAPGRLQHRHTLEVPRVSTSRISRDTTRTVEETLTGTGHYSATPNTPTRRRASISLVRRVTRSAHSDVHLDQVPHTEDAERWAEAIRQKRASKRRRRDDEDEDRVVMGTKVDQDHANWVTAYNMLTGIRFTVSRTNAKLDRDLTDADFEAKHKFSFDVTGNELTPSAKYDFKFKDYAPWVFRHLRSTFRLDPADYLMSLTSKYILSELGSPGKSGSFFYFSRDYKYIIKTIHHAEHKCLRKILKDYYKHIQDNPNTLLSQFYGLHRVKVPYGRKIHFVVMNNLFPPHRDIHRTFDLKGSTTGRDFKEDDLENNPRATLKDLNWLRRDMHLEFGPTKKRMFIEQMQRDVKLLQRLKIMDYSLLIGIHDLSRGNEDNLRDKTLKVFQPGGDTHEAHVPLNPTNTLIRTASKLETARKAKELRETLMNEKPVPMGQSKSKMPEEMTESEKRGFQFYSDDGGFRATHENDEPGEVIYYLGIIDCLTHYGFIKRLEHFIKGLSGAESQISAIPPERYGDRFVRFITGVTKSRELAEQQALQRNLEAVAAAADARTSDAAGNESSSRPTSQVLSGLHHRQEMTKTDVVMERAERSAERSTRHGGNEANIPDRQLGTVRSPPTDPDGSYTLPVVEEAAESGSTGGRSRDSRGGASRTSSPMVDLVDAGRTDAHEIQGEKPPPTPPKDGQFIDGGPRPYAKRGRPPTPPTDSEKAAKDKKKKLPAPPAAELDEAERLAGA